MSATGLSSLPAKRSKASKHFDRQCWPPPLRSMPKIERTGQAAPVQLALQLTGKPTRLGITWREDDAEPGVVILNRVTPGSPAAAAGLRVNDRIYQIGGQDFVDGNAFRVLANQATGPVELVVELRGQIRTVNLVPATVLPATAPPESSNAEPSGQPKDTAGAAPEK